MIKNYLKVAWRNLVGNPMYSLINIGGLAIGMAVSFMLMLYVYNEFSFDQHNINIKRVYEVFRNQPSNGEIFTNTATPVPLAPALKKDFPEVDKVCRVNWGDDVLINYKNKALKINTMASDIDILDMFTFHYIYGSKKTAFPNQSSIVLTQSAAKALFGSGNPIGQIVKLYNQFPLRVSAVIADNPNNSSFWFRALISWDEICAQQNWIKQSGWGNYSFRTFLMLKANANLNLVQAKIKNIVAKYNPENKENTMFLYPLEKLHLYGEFKNGVEVGGKIDTVNLFLMLAIGILLIACINFMNLSTARSEHRAKEVGVRKTIGASRFTLIWQFMGESLFMAFFAMLIAIILMVLLIPRFNDLINLQLKLPYNNPLAWLGITLVTLFTGLVAGSYPAIFLSSFKPVKVLKGLKLNKKSGVKPRQVLVVVQFSFAIILILSSLFIFKQIQYIKNQPIGYDKNGLVDLPSEGSLDNRFENFRLDAINAGAITDGAITSSSIVNNGSNSWGIVWDGQLPGEDKLPIDIMAVTYHFVKTFGVKLIEGRDFSEAYPSDSVGIILNQAAVKLMKFKHPIGQLVTYQSKKCKVVGVIENFVWGSPYEPVTPAIIGFAKGWTGNIALRLNPNKSISASLDILKVIYKKYNPEYPFTYKFADEEFKNKFYSEQLLGTMSVLFTCLAIIISSLGLFGLASFSAEQRKKEIGIRKVLGASIQNLWVKLSREFLILVIISFAIGAIISYNIIHKWLLKFTYHTQLSPWVFLLTLIISLLICLLTVSWQAVKASMTNPVKNLRSE